MPNKTVAFPARCSYKGICVTAQDIWYLSKYCRTTTMPYFFTHEYWDKMESDGVVSGMTFVCVQHAKFGYNLPMKGWSEPKQLGKYTVQCEIDKDGKITEKGMIRRFSNKIGFSQGTNAVFVSYYERLEFDNIVRPSTDQRVLSKITIPPTMQRFISEAVEKRAMHRDQNRQVLEVIHKELARQMNEFAKKFETGAMSKPTDEEAEYVRNNQNYLQRLMEIPNKRGKKKMCGCV